jgi:uncharacterized protein YprB with RNaseH-like and TPR domain
LSPRDPVFLIGSCNLTDGIEVKCLFARDYSEERTIIRYFLDTLSQYDIVMTYNGKRFDLKRLSTRATLNGITLANQNHLSLIDFLGNRHIDLFALLRQRASFPGGRCRLQDFERYCLGYIRRGDLHGEQIPDAYYEYVYGREKDSYDEQGIRVRGKPVGEQDAIEKIDRVLAHNMQDTLVLPAVLIYLCS